MQTSPDLPADVEVWLLNRFHSELTVDDMMLRALHKIHRLFVGHFTRHYGYESRVATAVNPLFTLQHSPEERLRLFCMRRFASGQESTSFQLHSASHSKGSLQINWMKGEGDSAPYQSRFDNFWLRDSCRCPQCLYHDNQQRLFDTASQPISIQLERVTVSTCSSFLIVQWQDGHESTYSANWLLENNYDCSEELLKIVPRSDFVKGPTAWGREIGNNPPCVGYDNVMKDDKCFLEMSDKLEEYGFCLIEQVPHELEATKNLTQRIGVIRESFYGGICIVEPVLNKHDTAYTNLPIESHTDANYFQESPGLMVFHTLKFEGTEPCQNYFVDGQKLCEIIEQEEPTIYQILCSVPLPYAHIDASNQYFNSYIPFTINPDTRQLSELHFNNHDRLPLNRSTLESLQKIIPPGTLLDVYEAIQYFLTVMRRKELWFSVRLKPDIALVLNNHRVMHARTGFKGKKTLATCYINREDWRSNVMSLRKKVLTT